MLLHTIAQPGDGGTLRAVDVERDELVTPDAGDPRGIDLDDGATDELEDPVGGVVSRRRVGLPGLVDAFWDVRRRQHEDLLDLAEQLLDDVVPMWIHVEDDASAVLPPIVP